jgi:hypothetical protein
METRIVAEVNPAYSELFLAPLRHNGLRAYTKDLNIDGWVRSVDIFLIYDDAQELRRAREIVGSMDI